jgi:hypothetical protein
MRNGFLGALVVAAMVVAPGSAQSSCLTRLPIWASLESEDADFAILHAHSRGPELLHLKVGLYSFHGRVMAERHLGTLDADRRVRLVVRNELHHGKYTLYAEGDPNHNRSCGPKHWSRVVSVGEDDSGDGGGGNNGEDDSSGGNPDDSIPPDQRL